MGLNKEGGEEQEDYLTPSLLLKCSFHTLSLTLLTLLLPLSYLLLARLTSPSRSSAAPPFSTLTSIFLHSNPLLLHSLISFLSISSLLQSLTGHHLHNPPTIISWAFLCTFQVCITLSVEATIAAGFKPATPTIGIGRVMWIERAIFFVGLYETMLVWGRMFVRPVVDETVFGVRVEGRVDKAAIGVAFGALWLWMLRDEVGMMVLAAGKGGLGNGMVGWNDFVLWLVSYSTVATGIVRIVEAALWMGKQLFLFLCCRGGEDEVSVCSVSGSEEV